MATPNDPNLGNVVNNMVALGLEIPDTAVGHLQALRKSILQLPSALKAERKVVAEQLSKIAGERNRLRVELDQTKDENRRLRRETRQSEDQGKLAEEKGNTATANVRVTNDSGERSKEGRGDKSLGRAGEDAARVNRERDRGDRAADHLRSREEVKDSNDTDPPRRVSEGVIRINRDRDREDRAVDPRRSRFDKGPRVPSDAPRGPAIPNTRAADSYRPTAHTSTKRPAPDDESPQPSKHTKRPSSPDLRALDSTNALLKARRGAPVCGACKKHAREDACDGKADCGTCQRLPNVVCSYRYCEDDRECEEANCTYLHSHQWDEKEEGWERIVRDRRGRFLSRKRTR